MPPDNRIRVLLIAEACNPTWTSVPLVGYRIARSVAGRPDLDVTVVTHVRNRDAIATSDLAEHARVHYIDNEYVAAPAYRLARLLRRGDELGWTLATALHWPSYVVFELMAWHQFRDQLRRREFDLIHRVTPLSPTAVSPLASRSPVPMIAGPLNGGLAWPKEYPELVAQEREWLVPLRRAYRFLPYHRSTYRHLAGVISASSATAAEVSGYFHGAHFNVPENGIDDEAFPIAPRWREPDARFCFVTTGRLVPYKGLSLTLEAIRSSPVLRSCELVVIGDGPDLPAHKAFVSEHGLDDCVTFIGNVAHDDVAHHLQHAQAFVFPSLREFGGAVVLEAMASALPSIIVDYGGPTELLDERAGIKLPMRPRDELVPLLRDAMERLATDHDLARAMGDEAARHAPDHTWHARAERYEQIYRDVLRAVPSPRARTANVTTAAALVGAAVLGAATRPARRMRRSRSG